MLLNWREAEKLSTEALIDSVLDDLAELSGRKYKPADAVKASLRISFKEMERRRLCLPLADAVL